ncbi:MAG TPA: SLOG family protein [Prevotella sp.]|nr:SLOG family protein [Prevotella sp.]
MLDEREDLLLYRTQTNISRVSSGYLRKAAGYSDFYIEQGYQYFGAGGALGFDTLAAQTVLNLKQWYPCIKLILVLPCKDQAARWRANDVKEYERIKSHADKIVYTADRYFNGCMQKKPPFS